jgi:histone H3/H4
MTKQVTVRTQIKELAVIDGKPLSVSEDFYTAIEEEVKKMMEKACKRAKANSRNTVMGRDI